MNRISFQWRITLMTAVLIAGACICLNLLLYHSGATGMDNLNGYVLQYQQSDDENLTIEIPDDQMSDFLIQFSQEVYDAKAVFGRKGWCITAAVTLLSAAIAYFVSGKALEPLKKLAQQAERIDQDSLVEVRLEENTIPEFRDLSQSVNRMLDRLAHSFDLQRQFAGNAAHELKTPLMAIQGYAEGIQAGVMDTASAAEVILAESDRMTELVDELLDISKIDMGRQRLALSEMDVRELLYDSIRAVEPAAAASGIAIVPDFPEEPVMVSCDDTRLRRAVTNILSNGVRYARSQLRLTCRADKRHVTIQIQDDGDGIAEADLPHIFDRFYMGKSGKSGIGLALTREIIHLHKGTIRAYNGDSGAVFEISIPVSR